MKIPKKMKDRRGDIFVCRRITHYRGLPKKHLKKRKSGRYARWAWVCIDCGRHGVSTYGSLLEYARKAKRRGDCGCVIEHSKRDTVSTAKVGDVNEGVLVVGIKQEDSGEVIYECECQRCLSMLEMKPFQYRHKHYTKSRGCLLCRNKRYLYNGIPTDLDELSKELGVSRRTLSVHINKYDLYEMTPDGDKELKSVAEAFFYCINGANMSPKEICTVFGVKFRDYVQRLNAGWTETDAAVQPVGGDKMRNFRRSKTKRKQKEEAKWKAKT